MDTRILTQFYRLLHILCRTRGRAVFGLRLVPALVLYCFGCGAFDRFLWPRAAITDLGFVQCVFPGHYFGGAVFGANELGQVAFRWVDF